MNSRQRKENKGQPPRSPSLKARVFWAGSWIVAGHVFALALRLLTSLIMTRLLAPDVFGIMAIATAVHVVIALLADIGLFQSIVQSSRGEDRTFLNTAWTLQILRGFLVWFACVVVAAVLYVSNMRGSMPIDSVYAAPILPAVLVAASLTAIITGFRSTKALVGHRNLDLKRISLIELLAQLVGFFIAVVLGWLTRSIWSFVISGLITTALSTGLSHVWLAGPANRFAWDRNCLHELLHFGKWIFISSALGVLAMNADRLLLGAWVGPATLGYYSIAFNLATVVEGLAARLFGTVSFAALSEIARQQPERVLSLYFRMRWVVDVVFVGMAGLLFASGDWLIALLFDERYAPAGPMLRLLSFGLLLGRYGLLPKVYVALGRPDYEAMANVIKVISVFVLVPGLYVAFGVEGAVLGMALHMAPVVSWMFWLNQKNGLNNVWLELTVLAMWPVGWLAGSALVAVFHR